MEYFMTAKQISEVAAHLEGWGNQITDVVYYTPEVFIVTMQNAISEKEINSLDLLRV